MSTEKPNFEIKSEIETKPEENPEKFLEFEKLTQPNEEIIRTAESLRGATEEESVKNILSFIGNEDNLKNTPLEEKNKKEWKKLFNQRSSEEVLKTKESYGCTDTAELFISLARKCNIPTKLIEGKRIGKAGTHSWVQIFNENKWIDIDPTQGIRGTEFNPEESEHGPYVVISKSLGPSDSLITSWEDWRKIEKDWDYKTNTWEKGKEPKLSS
jgi:hypothetical protein